MGTPLADAFLAARDGADAPPREALEPVLTRLIDAAREALPAVSVRAIALAGTLAQHPAAAKPETIEPGSVADVALALACARADAAALRTFEGIVRDVVPGALAHMKLGAERVDEVTQKVRERLLVSGDGEPPRIGRYAARGALRGLVAVVASRIAIETTRSDQREPRAGGEAGDVPAAGALGPELMLVKEEYRAAFRDAFTRAIGALDAHDRNLLRLNLVGGMTLEQLAKMYGMHRATVVRNLARIRQQLFSATKKSLQAELRIDEREFESLLGIVESRMDMSVMSLLREEDVSSSKA